MRDRTVACLAVVLGAGLLTFTITAGVLLALTCD